MVEGNTAILLEETAPDIFSMKLGQLKPGAGAKVKLTYIMELPVEDKSIRLTIPTTIAPRYKHLTIFMLLDKRYDKETITHFIADVSFSAYFQHKIRQVTVQ